MNSMGNAGDMNLNGDGMLVARGASKASHTFGMLLVVLGIFAVLTPLFTGIAASIMLAMLLSMAGLVLVVFAFQSKTMGKGLLRILFGGLSLITAFVIYITPEKGLGFLTAILTAYLLLGGLLDLLLLARVPVGEGKGWMLFNGIVGIALGLLVIFQWPASGTWAVGLYLGIRLLISGMMLIGLGNTGKVALTHLQDVRIAQLERQVLESAEALADHTAMLLVLKNELGKKVAAEDVDPAIVELNQSLGAARSQAQAVNRAAKEGWVQSKAEASAAFNKLQKNTADLSKRLKNELGLDA